MCNVILSHVLLAILRLWFMRPHTHCCVVHSFLCSHFWSKHKTAVTWTVVHFNEVCLKWKTLRTTEWAFFYVDVFKANVRTLFVTLLMPMLQFLPFCRADSLGRSGGKHCFPSTHLFYSGYAVAWKWMRSGKSGHGSEFECWQNACNLPQLFCRSCIGEFLVHLRENILEYYIHTTYVIVSFSIAVKLVSNANAFFCLEGDRGQTLWVVEVIFYWVLTSNRSFHF